MLNIKVINRVTNKLNPVEMLDNKYANCVFQQYDNNIPQNDFYINCGINEKSVIHIWYNDESEQYRFSTDDEKSLLKLFEHITVVKIDAKISLKIKF